MVSTVGKVEAIEIRMIKVADASLTRGIVSTTNLRIGLISDAHHSRNDVRYLFPAAA